MGGALRAIHNTVDGIHERAATVLTTADQTIVGLQHNASAVLMNLSNESTESLRRITHQVEQTIFLLTNGILASITAIVLTLLFLVTSSSLVLRYAVGLMFVVLCAYMLLTYMENSQSVTLSASIEQAQVSTEHQNAKLEEIIAQSQNCCEIDLIGRQMVDNDMAIVISQAIICKRCRKLRLGQNKITSTGGARLANALIHNDILEELSLWSNNLFDTGTQLLVKPLEANRNVLKKLDLSENGITTEGVRHLAQMLKINKILSHLSLCRNQINDEGAQILARVIQNRNNTLEVLSLSDNKLLTDACVNAFIAMIQHNRSLTKLYIDDCKLSQTGQSRLQSAAKSKKNFRIYL